MKFTEELSRLSDAATQGEWKTYWRVTDKNPDCGVFAEPREGMAYSVCRCPQYQKRDQWDTDSKLIALLANHRREILALVKAMQEIAEFGCDEAERFDGPCATKIVKIAQKALVNLDEVKP